MRRPAVLLLALLATVASAQDDEREFTDSWYRIELLIFANRDPDAALAESWPLLPQLEYPERWQTLESSDPRLPADQPFDLVTVEDTVPTPDVDLFWERSIDALLREYQQKQVLRQPDVALEPLADLETPLDVPRQRVLLPAEARELNSQRRRINNSAGLEVLMHQSWLQRIPDRDIALPLILDGPVQFGDYPELQGSVLFYSGRYLHIATDLWLNTDGSYLDEDPTTAGWSMPRPPLPVDQSEPPAVPFEVTVLDEWFADLEARSYYPSLPGEGRPETWEDSSEEADTSQGGISVFMPLQEEAAEEEEPEIEQAEERSFLFGSEEEAPSHPPATEEQMEAFMAREVVDYDFRHAVRVAQQRRMRSGELHYIDHPLLGIVVKISRHEFLPFTNLDEFNAE